MIFTGRLPWSTLTLTGRLPWSALTLAGRLPWSAMSHFSPVSVLEWP